MMQLTHDFIDALHRLEESGNVEVIASLFADDAELANPLVTCSADDVNGAKAFWSTYRDAFDEVSSEFRSVLDGDGTAMFEWFTIAKIDGQDIRYDGVSVIEMSEGQITAFRTYFDPRKLSARAAGGPSVSADEDDAQPEKISAESEREAAEARSAGGYS